MFVINNYCVYEYKFLVSSHSFLPTDCDFGSMEMRIRKANYLYILEHYYELIKLRRTNEAKGFYFNKTTGKLNNKKSNKYTKIYT